MARLNSVDLGTISTLNASLRRKAGTLYKRNFEKSQNFAQALEDTLDSEPFIWMSDADIRPIREYLCMLQKWKMNGYPKALAKEAMKGVIRA